MFDTPAHPRSSKEVLCPAHGGKSPNTVLKDFGGLIFALILLLGIGFAGYMGWVDNKKKVIVTQIK